MKAASVTKWPVAKLNFPKDKNPTVKSPSFQLSLKDRIAKHEIRSQGTIVSCVLQKKNQKKPNRKPFKLFIKSEFHTLIEVVIDT